MSGAAGAVIQLVGANSLGNPGKAVRLQPRRQIPGDRDHKTRPLEDHGRIELHGAGPSADPGIGLSARPDAANPDQDQPTCRRPMEFLELGLGKFGQGRARQAASLACIGRAQWRSREGGV